MSLSESNSKYQKKMEELCLSEKYEFNDQLMIDIAHWDDKNMFERLIQKCGDSSRIMLRSISEKRTHVNSDYLLLIFVNEELSNEDEKFINFRRNEGKKTFVLTMFPDKIYLPDYDVSGLPQIIETAEECSDFPCAISIMTDLEENIEKYVDKLLTYIDLDICIKKLEKQEEEDRLFQERVEDIFGDNDLDGWEWITLFWNVDIILENSNKILRSLKYFKSEIDTVKADYQIFANKCRNKIVEKKFSRKDVSDFAADLLIKYGDLQWKVESCLKQFRQDELISDSFYKETLDNAIALMKKKAAIAFVGTFSSGKTSFINWLLDMEGNKQFRTSGGHNTAILTHIKQAEREEKIEVSYKHGADLFDWFLYKTDENERLADKYDGEDGIVIDVDEYDRVIKIRTDGEEKIIGLKNSDNEILIKKGQKLRRGDWLTKGYKEDEVPLNMINVKMRPIEEYESILNSIKNKDLQDIRLIISYINQNSRSKDLIIREINEDSRIRKIVEWVLALRKKTSSNVRLDNIAGNFRNMEIPGLPEGFLLTQIEIKAKCYKQNDSEILTDDIWRKFCGKGSNNDNIISENPDGYLYTNGITYFLNKGFLEFSDIIDTPGLGSVSDEHDVITESYIRGSMDSLLVMIRVDKNAMKQENRKLIHNIAEIFQNSGRDLKTVYFVCNLWSTQIIGEREKTVFKKYCDNYFELIVKDGFSKDNFYVIDIRKMQTGKCMDKLFGYRSDMEFKKNFVDYIAATGIQNSLLRVNDMVFRLLGSQIKENNELKDRYLKDAEDREKRIDDCRRAISYIEKITLNSFENLYDHADELHAEAITIRSLSSLSEWEELFADDVYCDIDNIESMVYENDGEGRVVVDHIVDNFKHMTNKIINEWEDATNSDYTERRWEMINSVNRIGVKEFPFTILKNKLKEQENSFYPRFRFRKNKRISKQGAKDISDFIEGQLAVIKEKNIMNYDILVKKFQMQKIYIINDLEEKIKNLSSENTEDARQRCICRIELLNQYKLKWKSDIVPELKMVGAYNE